MDMKAVFAHYSHWLDNAIDADDFLKYYFQIPFVRDLDEFGYQDVHIACGAFRGCLISDCCDYVVKFPICPDGLECCEREERIYDHALSQDLQDYFVEPIYLGDYEKVIHFYRAEDIDDYYDEFEQDFYEVLENHVYDLISEEIVISIPLYAYPKAHVFSTNHWRKKSTEETANKVCSSCSPLKDNMVTACAIYAEYGKEVFDKLSNFAFQEGINDLHAHNIGYLNNHLVIIDYAGA